MSEVLNTMEEVTPMINEETRRKLRELGLDGLVEALDSQEASLNNYVSLDFDRKRLALGCCPKVFPTAGY